jgi:hypothetical protein
MMQQRKKIRFNFIDALIILLILAVIAAASYLIYTAMHKPRAAITNGTIEFEVRISNVDASALPLIKEGDTVKDSVTGEVLGKILSVSAEKAKYVGNVAVEEDGNLTLAVTDYDDLYDVYVKISADALADDRGICTVGTTRILIGSPVYFKVTSFKSVSYITEFSTRNAG